MTDNKGLGWTHTDVNLRLNRQSGLLDSSSTLVVWGRRFLNESVRMSGRSL